MGLLNYITNNTYVNVDSIQYIKNERCLRFDVLIYTDKTKKRLLASKHFIISAHTTYPRMQGHTDTPPADAKTGDAWLTKQNATDEWFGRDNLIAIKEGNSWAFWGIDPHTIFFYVPTQKYCHLVDGNIVEADIDKIEDITWWDSWFSSEVICSGTTNLQKQIYLYLKQLPEFKNTLEC